ncbi:MAG: hypothetical protein H3C30_09890 [Candidatus Hydrogenedentes bacterium]|nr:hypothetical protein [Candidatus Hydrogenedentota bacterium]
MGEQLLVYVPGWPARIEAFLPKDRLARLAGRELARGGAVRILDYGTPAHLERFSFLCPSSDSLADPESLSWWRQPWLRWNLSEKMRQWHTDISREIGRHRPHAVVYLAETAGDYFQARQVALRVRDMRPDTPQAVCGPFAELLGAHDKRRAPFTGACPACGLDSPTGMTGEGEGSLPCHSPAVYPALYGGGKFQVFPLSLDRPPTLELMRAPAVAREMREMDAGVAVRVFHVDGVLSAAEAGELAAELLARRVEGQYSLGCLPGPQSDSVWALSRAAGCRAVEWLVPSGSQRLIDDYYRLPFGMSEARRAVRMCRMAGIFTAVRMLWPCPEDDRHTRAESAYFLEKAQPDSVMLDTPRATERPDSRHAGDRHGLLDELRNRGFTVQMRAWQGMTARLCGHENRESRFLARLGDAVCDGDWAVLSDEIAAFNRELAQPRPRAVPDWDGNGDAYAAVAN